MNYYIVTAKCGHVGRGKYYEVEFPIKADSKSEAAQLCLAKPKVKKHLRNAITIVCEVSHEEYLECLAKYRANSYMKSHTKKEILEYIEIAEKLVYKKKNKKNSFNSRNERVFYVLKKYKIQEEYCRA